EIGGEIGAHVVSETETASLLKQQDAHCRELFCQRRRVKYGVRPDSNAVVEIGYSVAARVDNVAGFDHGNRAPRRIRSIEFRKDIVDLSVMRSHCDNPRNHTTNRSGADSKPWLPPASSGFTDPLHDHCGCGRPWAGIPGAFRVGP